MPVSAHNAEEMVTVCPNIGPAERRKRNIAGLVGAALTVLALGALLETRASWVMRLIVALPAFLAAMGFLQARAQTCVAFARKNIRVLDDGAGEKVDDTGMQQAIARQARAVYLQAFAATAVVVLLTIALP